MTQKQDKFIRDLVDQLGYRDSVHKDGYLKKIGHGDFTDIRFASEIISRLLKEVGWRKYPKRKKLNEEEYRTVNDLSQFVFCPASFSVKECYKIERHEALNNSDESDLRESLLLRRIHGEDNSIETEFDFYRTAKLAFNGTDENSDIFYNHEFKLKGKPHLIFESSGKRKLVLEKLTFNLDRVKNPWENHTIQALAYMFLFKETRCKEADIIYWSVENSIPIEFRNYKIFTLDLENFYNSIVTLPANNFNLLLKDKSIPFSPSSINAKKCYSCSCRAICNHKSGLIEGLSLPYETPDYDKKYPQYYTMAELISFAEIAQEDILNEIYSEINSAELADDFDIPEEALEYLMDSTPSIQSEGEIKGDDSSEVDSKESTNGSEENKD
jgi:CRISPR/Cas system-associated exonuclease Cas4 (RecB family)